MKAYVFDIQKFSVHDGPGIRTNVFLKGCPLRCIWCHNPESWHTQPELLYNAEKCAGCRNCEKLCPNACHAFHENAHRLDRQNCTACGKCTEECYTGALELCGKMMETDEVLREVLKDRLFYENSKGGMTISGGEPMMHFDFTRELFQKAKAQGLHNCLESCGFAPWEHFKELLPLVDIFLMDVKSVNPEKHRRFTGQDNALILENLHKLDEAGAAICLRCPLIPGLNDENEDLLAIAHLANQLSHVLSVDVEPYHPMGVSKAKHLGINDGFAADFASEKDCERWLKLLSANTSVPVRKN